MQESVIWYAGDPTICLVTSVPIPFLSRPTQLDTESLEVRRSSPVERFFLFFYPVPSLDFRPREVSRIGVGGPSVLLRPPW